MNGTKLIGEYIIGRKKRNCFCGAVANFGNKRSTQEEHKTKFSVQFGGERTLLSDYETMVECQSKVRKVPV